MVECKKFYEYADVNGHICVNEVTYPHCPTWGDEDEVFLVYAENKDKAFRLAMQHLYEGLPFSKFYGDYAEEHWDGVKCIME